MGIYTIRNEKKVDDRISKDMKILLEFVLTVVGKENISSLILVGGFGRGEGSVIVKNKAMTPLNDYDLLLVVKKPLTKRLKQKIKSVSKKLAKQFKIDFVDIDIVTYNDLDRFDQISIANYEILNKNIVIFGEPLRNKKINPKKIPLFEVTRLMLNRAGGMLMAKLVLEDYKDNRDVKRFVYIQCMKAILALGDAYLLLNKKYDSSYEQRMGVIQGFGVLEKQFLSEYKRFSKFKLMPNTEYEKTDVGRLWKKARTYHEKYFMKFEEIRLQKKFEGPTNWFNEFIKERNAQLNLFNKLKFLLYNTYVFGVPNTLPKKYFLSNTSIRRQSVAPLLLYSIDSKKDYSSIVKKVLNEKRIDNKKLIQKYIKIWHELPWLFSEY